MGLASGFFYAAQGLLAKDIMKKVSGYYTAFWQSLIITIMFLFFVKIGSVQIAINHWWKFLGLGILGAGIPTILFMRGIQKVPAQQIFIITSLEPLMGTIFALLFLREFPTFMTLIGAFFIFYGVYRITYSKARSPYNEVGT
jgi:drug/metabolite transporter (DMT)-like permease